MSTCIFNIYLLSLTVHYRCCLKTPFSHRSCFTFCLLHQINNINQTILVLLRSVLQWILWGLPQALELVNSCDPCGPVCMTNKIMACFESHARPRSSQEAQCVAALFRSSCHGVCYGHKYKYGTVLQPQPIADKMTN